ncbi:UDP-glucose 4-epimerase GalE [Polynucleobacter paneuropaeus]|uniref:UDP-glucose 4-epimerase n=1 Tax=Polynucleobacter paneuropaeus TaxID=2527775 RepID=A0AAE2YLL0_9BURK|nr:UDP-glucose 4-epimerase GalE [Polynucleobacter paneuropaeus]MBT8591833.1 UDP-glucose 4-epimerase GalE [Polynucleobacter paneuropaeus]MBT8597224.1 UDP-glucose 4-epimerase GalE [Polynucleobacter paneuropaeus]MBT8599037.1 UDP-glucose 4-epimerase GalE [Polynucleobacter paneuropaeus]
MNILLTGGAGYIGSHTAVVLSQAGHEVVLLDNFCNSSPSVLERLQKILGKALPCVEADVRNTDAVEKVLREYKIDAVIHFAGLKAVGESVANPVLYYANNVQGSISLLQAMQQVGIKTLVFSSSATVYGQPQYLPYDEDHPTNPTNPYGQSKIQVEAILRDLAASDSEWKIICLRYFNPVGSHESGLIGEEPSGLPNNLMPFIAQVAAGKLPHLNVYGNDYPTSDGTGVRDYIHVMDLAEGHLAALTYTQNHQGWDVFNLGTGHGVSVLEMVSSYQQASGKEIAYQVKGRRIGDIASCYAGVQKSQALL